MPALRVHVSSDWHTNFWTKHVTPEQVLPTVPVDLCIMAGDIGTATQDPTDWLKQYQAHVKCPVVVVLGNHDFYGALYSDTLRVWQQRKAVLEPFCIYLLERDSVTLKYSQQPDGLQWQLDPVNGQFSVQILGCVLWSMAADACKHQLSDYRAIYLEDATTLIRPKDMRQLFQESKNWLEVQCAKVVPNQCARIIVTHYLPSFKSVHRDYEHDNNTGFATDLDRLVQESDAQHWFHGHTHRSMNYFINKTRVVCNPFGYGGENTAFDRDLIVPLVFL